MRKLFTALAIFLGMASTAMAQIGPCQPAPGFNSYCGYANNGNLSSNQSYLFNTATYEASKIAAQVSWSSATIPNAAFTDGAQSSATITINSFAALSTAAASSNIKVSTTAGMFGMTVSMSCVGTSTSPTTPPNSFPCTTVFPNTLTFQNGLNWFTLGNSSSAALSLAAAMRTSLPGWSIVASTAAPPTASVIYATAPVGAQYNGIQFQSSNINAINAPVYISSTPATGNITISSYTLLVGQSVTIGPVTFIGSGSTNIGWINSGVTEYFNAGGSNTACAINLSSAINNNPILDLVINSTSGANGNTSTSNIVYTTATVGGVSGNYFIYGSSPTATAWYGMAGGSNAVFNVTQGGQSNAVLTINNISLTANSQWFPVTSNNVTAISLASAIVNSASLGGLVLATAPGNGAIVYASSTFNGAQYNYNLVSSTPTQLIISSAQMQGGVTPGDVLNSQIFTSTNTTFFPLGMQVLYSTGGSASLIGGLVNQTTYYVVPLNAGTFELAFCSSCAIQGGSQNFAKVTSTLTHNNAGLFTYTLTPLNFTLTGVTAAPATIQWRSSNDGINFFNAVSSTGGFIGANITLTTAAAINTQGFDFGIYNYKFLQLNISSASIGSILFQPYLNIKQDGIGPY
jgi:hypothetical protein